MRISTQSPSVDVSNTTNQINYSKKSNESKTENKKISDESSATKSPEQLNVIEQHQKQIEENIAKQEEVPKEKVQQAVKSLNKFLEVNNTSSKFVFHEGLDKYFVQMIDKETEEVIKEIPPKKLLDAFYEMQKLVGMIVDEKI